MRRRQWPPDRDVRLAFRRAHRSRRPDSRAHSGPWRGASSPSAPSLFADFLKRNQHPLLDVSCARRYRRPHRKHPTVAMRGFFTPTGAPGNAHHSTQRKKSLEIARNALEADRWGDPRRMADARPLLSAALALGDGQEIHGRLRDARLPPARPHARGGGGAAEGGGALRPSQRAAAFHPALRIPFPVREGRPLRRRSRDAAGDRRAGRRARRDSVCG